MAVAVILHPHPHMGGDSSHPLVQAIAQLLAACSVSVVTPDLRDPDLDAAIATLDAVVDAATAEPVYLVGYSWGAAVASHARPPGLSARVLVAPPVSMPLGLEPAALPTLVLVPEHDQFGGIDATRRVFGGQAAAAIEVVRGADHFLWGSIDAIAERAVAFLLSPRQ